MSDDHFTLSEDIHGLPPGLLRALAQVESSMRPHAISPKGALGLMQIKPTTARQYGYSIRDLMDPDIAPYAAGAILDDLRSRSSNPNNMTEWLGDYNTGRSSKNRESQERYTAKIIDTMTGRPQKPFQSALGARMPQKFAGGGLAILRQSMSNPAWLKATAAAKHARSTPEEARRIEEFLSRLRELEEKSPLDSATSFTLQRNIHKLRPSPLPPPYEQLPLELE